MVQLRVGTRGSRLALWQAEWATEQLARRHPRLELERVVIRVESDRRPDVPITAMDARGIFTSDIELALLEGRIDLAVHSLKDLPSEDAAGLVVAAASPREDPRDVLLAADGRGLDHLARGARVGTSSLRRTALLRERRPDLAVAPLRGNIDTRLRKLRVGEYDAIVMAAAALRRLDEAVPAQPLPPEWWIPAVAQGIIGIQARAGDERVLGLLRDVGDAEAMFCASVERAFLHSLGGGCSVPVGGLATLADGVVELRAFVGSAAGGRVLRVVRRSPVGESERLGPRVAAALRALGADTILEDLRRSVPLVGAEQEANPARADLSREAASRVASSGAPS